MAAGKKSQEVQSERDRARSYTSETKRAGMGQRGLQRPQPSTDSGKVRWTVKRVQPLRRATGAARRREGRSPGASATATQKPLAGSSTWCAILAPWQNHKSDSSESLAMLAPVHSPEMFIRVHTAAARWIVKHKPDLVTLDFDDLLADPVTALASLDAWTGEAGFPGRFAEHAGKIRQRLRRSADHETPEQSQKDDAWEDAEEVYEASQDGRLRRHCWTRAEEGTTRKGEASTAPDSGRKSLPPSAATALRTRRRGNNLRKTASSSGRLHWLTRAVRLRVPRERHQHRRTASPTTTG